MIRTLHRRRWLSLVPAAFFVAGAFPLAGCGGGADLDAPPTAHPDLEKNQNAMEEFYKKKKSGRSGKAN
jgi:hypothetical protein